ncbi:lipid-A-disaccharide synthase [Rhizobium helianthi]|uniref:Lipid-A-disaccharide synthase n=1 Tax=Rhizobium helianthi TaxID=1132695 RepID=A0ABW4LZ48_9HYPH
MNTRPLRLAIVAGEVSGDLLAADLVDYLQRIHQGPVELIGVGGDALEERGLKSFFDFSELSIMGITQVLKRLPQLWRRIRQTVDQIVAARPDALIIVDSPDFTHRVAKAVREKLPTLPVIDYVCPSVWAWKEYRAKKMLGYVDLVLALLPFEPRVMAKLGGPETRFVGHRLTVEPNVLQVRSARRNGDKTRVGGPRVLLLPGSRSTEINALMPVLQESAELILSRQPRATFLLPTVPRQVGRVTELLKTWPVQPQLTCNHEEKWEAFAQADVALAASGTVTLELALCGVPTVSIYKTDWLMTLLTKRIKVWSAALPNIIADYPVIPEQINVLLRPGYLARWVDVLSADTPHRRAMLSGFDSLWDALSTDGAPGEVGARHVLSLLKNRGII